MLKIKRNTGGWSAEQTSELFRYINEGTASFTCDHYWAYIAFYNPEDEIAFRLKYEHQIPAK